MSHYYWGELFGWRQQIAQQFRFHSDGKVSQSETKINPWPMVGQGLLVFIGLNYI
jgi:hypothetical protein